MNKIQILNKIIAIHKKHFKKSLKPQDIRKYSKKKLNKKVLFFYKIFYVLQ